MRYSPEQVERLAAEYVVGTLHGRARQRFDRLLYDRADVRHAVWGWERLLHEVTADVAPVAPPRSIWRHVRRRIDAGPRVASPRWRLRFAVAVPIIAALAFWLGTIPTPPAPQADRIAVFADDSARALWIVSADPDRRVLIAESAGVDAAPDGRVYELWALPANEAPRSLGVLDPQAGRSESPLDDALIAALDASAALAISLEPPGGSPTGAPTGPIVYQATLARL